MAGAENLTRAECNQRALAVHDVSYQVDLDLTNAGSTAPTFTSQTTVTFAATDGAQVWIDIIAESIDSATLNGVALDTAHYDGARLALPELQPSNELIVVAQCRYMRSGEGLHRFLDPVDDETYLYTQFEVADARRMYACFEQPSIKATWQLSVAAPAHWQVVSNAPTPEPKSAGIDANVWQFDATPPISTYITALVAGPYFAVRDTYSGRFGSYPLGVFCRKSMADSLDAPEIFQITKEGFEFFENVFDTPYPFAKYDQLFVPEFNAGAMENAGCVTLLEDYVFRSRVTHAAYEQRANTILHELAHMWFGDLVTMRWWDDLWLNESFAEWASHYASVEATKFTDAWTSFLNQRKAWAYRQDQLPSTHPIAADMSDLDAVRVNFDGITYAKGAAALRQLVAWVGETEFIAGLREYFREHAWGNTELEDLLRALSASSGRPLDGWARQWLQTSGANLLRPELRLSDNKTYEQVLVRQEPPSAPDGVAPTLRDHRIGVGLYDITDSGTVELRRRTEIDLTGPSASVDEFVGEPAADLVLINDADLTYAKIRLDQDSMTTAIRHLGSIEDSLARALVWGAAWDMTRDAEMSTGDYLELVLRGIHTESDVGVVQQVLRQLRMAIDLYAAPHNREYYQRQLAAELRTLAQRSEPGSDHQLAFIRSFLSTASDEPDTHAISGWLTGREVPPGLLVDEELRWAMVANLVVNGLAQSQDIDAEQARDDTAAGRRHAVYCRAALPTAAAKAIAWDKVLNDVNIANHDLAATISGIMVPQHRELLRPHVDEYFDSLTRTWEVRTNEMAQQITSDLYPGLLVEPDLITRTEDYLTHHDELPQAANRLLGEELDGVMRAMRCQERDAR